MADRFVIRYESRSTVNGEPVGTVYALDIGHLSPGCWSYDTDPGRATRFTSFDEAFATIQRHRWPCATVHKLHESTALGTTPKGEQ